MRLTLSRGGRWLLCADVPDDDCRWCKLPCLGPRLVLPVFSEGGNRPSAACHALGPLYLSLNWAI